MDILLAYVCVYIYFVFKFVNALYQVIKITMIEHIVWGNGDFTRFELYRCRTD